MGMSTEEIDNLIGQEVKIRLINPIEIQGIVLDTEPCLGETARSGIYVKVGPIAMERMHSLTIVDNQPIEQQ